MKSFLSLLLVFFAAITGFEAGAQSATPVQTTSPGCNSKCKWSNCGITVTYVVPPGGGCVCGCYGGLAMCHCEQNSTKALTNSQIVHLSVEGLQDFRTFLEKKHNERYVQLIDLLRLFNHGEMKGDDYAPLYDRYKATIEALPPAEKKEVLDYAEAP